MFRSTGLLLLIAALAWPLGEAAVCDPSALAAMPCCEEGMADCGTGGMTADCCILVPGDDLPPATASVSLDPASLCRDHLASRIVAVVPAAASELEVTQVREAAHARAPGPAKPFFVRSSVLRT